MFRGGGRTLAITGFEVNIPRYPELDSGSYKPVVSPTSQTPFTAICHLRPKVGDPAFLNLSKISNKLDSRATHENDIKIEFLLPQGARRRLGGVVC